VAVRNECRGKVDWIDSAPHSSFIGSYHKEPTQAASLVVFSKCKEMYGKILKSLTIVKLYRGMSKLKVEINVNLPQLLCIVVSVALNGEFERFGGFYVDCYYKL